MILMIKLPSQFLLFVLSCILAVFWCEFRSTPGPEAINLFMLSMKFFLVINFT